MNQKIREALCDMGHEDAVVFDNPSYDEAIIGVTDESQVVYDYDAMVKCLMKQEGIDEMEAIDFIDYNTIRAIPYAGDHAPIIMYRLKAEDLE